MNPPKSKSAAGNIVCVSDFVTALNTMAPAVLSEPWDNVGMQIGHHAHPVHRVWVALDPLAGVVEAACEDNADLLVCHHPLTIKGIRKIDLATDYGRIVRTCCRNGLTIVCAHTNLDAASGGLNDLWASQLGISVTRVLGSPVESKTYKLVVFVPLSAEISFLETFRQIQGAGRIGDYDMCTFRTMGIGTFRPGAQGKPHIGNIGEFNQVKEARLETVVAAEAVDSVLAACRKAHPYETMAYDLYPLKPVKTDQGIGRVGKLPQPVTLMELARLIKNRMALSHVRAVGRSDLVVDEVALCTGSGAGLLPAFFASSAQVFVSGDLRYHDARDIEQRQRGCIDVGHFASEHIVVAHLTEWLKKWCRQHDWPVSVQAAEMEKDPFFLV
jgi:dinuclear metal center YbgI/SA1388 family protein